MTILNKNFKLIGAGVLVASLSGCSTVSNLVGKIGGDYRSDQDKLATKLEMPPNIMEFRTLDQELLTMNVADLSKVDKVPSYQAEGIKVNSNLSERWLELSDLDSKSTWTLMRNFVESQGFQIQDERLDIGLLETNYVAREDIAPTELEESFLTRLLNKWRPEVAGGVYDKFTIRVEADEAQPDLVTRVYFRHHMMVAKMDDETTQWQVRPYDPMLETIALYKAMVFLGASQELAVAEIESATLYEGGKKGDEFSSIVLAAGKEEAWQYVQSLIYRADWAVKTQNTTLYQIWLQPKQVKAKSGLAKIFSKKNDRVVLLSLVDAADGKTEVTLKAHIDDRPLKPAEKQKIFNELGLLGQ